MPRPKRIAELQAEINNLTEEKDTFLAKSRARSAELHKALDEALAIERAREKLSSMSDSEKEAMAKELKVS